MLKLFNTLTRKRLNFTFEKMRNARDKIRRYYKCVSEMEKLKNGSYNKGISKLIKKVVGTFEKSMDDDLNITKAIETYFKFVSTLHKLAKEKSLNEYNKKEIMCAVKRINSVLGFLLPC
jgi:cysteinyl-tRNA synthetase